MCVLEAKVQQSEGASDSMMKKDSCELHQSRKQLTVIYELCNYHIVVSSESIFSKVIFHYTNLCFQCTKSKKKVFILPKQPIRLFLELSNLGNLQLHQHFVSAYVPKTPGENLSLSSYFNNTQTVQRAPSEFYFSPNNCLLHCTLKPQNTQSDPCRVLPAAGTAFPVGLCRN